MVAKHVGSSFPYLFSFVQVRQMFQSLSEEDRELQIQIGLDTLGQGNSFVTRSISSFNPRDQTVQARALLQICAFFLASIILSGASPCTLVPAPYISWQQAYGLQTPECMRPLPG